MNHRATLVVFLAAALLSGCGGGGALPTSRNGVPAAVARLATSSDTYSIGNDLPPRYQWNSNYGYCGEVSMISAGLYYGQYLSQYDARTLDGSGLPQNRYRSQLLVGVNAATAAANMHLSAVPSDARTGNNSEQFLAWVKSYVVVGDPAIIGIYMNQYLFYGDKNPNAGSDYDHIVPVIGISSNHPLTDTQYYGTDVITFNDNGEWTGTPNGQPKYVFSYEFGPFQKTRQQANSPTGTIYSLPDKTTDYGIAITGIIDEDHETVPVRVATNVNYERPAIKNGSNTRPTPMPLTLTITVSGLNPGTTYNLYRYDSMANVPNTAFNAHASQAYEHWTITISSGSTYTMSENIMSDDVAAYRAVPASAP
jgi:hypothetical protein